MSTLCCLVICLSAFSKENSSEDTISDLISKAEDMLKIDPSKAIYYSNVAITEAQKKVIKVFWPRPSQHWAKPI